MKYWEIGPTIRQRRKAHGWTQDELAKSVGVTRVTLSKLERGRLSGISLGLVLALLEHFGMEMEFSDGNSLPTLEDLAKRNEGLSYSSVASD